MAELTGKTREVFDAEEQLRQADRLTAIGQLTTGLAHEIRNPLGSIRGAAEILIESGTRPEQRREFGMVLIEETERLNQILSHFLDYARVHQKSDSVSPTEFRPVVDRLLLLMERKLHTSSIQLELEIPPALPALAISETLLQQVLLNLMLNAQQAMVSGGVLRIGAVAKPDLRKVILSVRDTGPGIPPDVRSKIFDPFFTTKPSGTGLGLSIVHKIVLGHHGRVWLNESSDQGAHILIELPCA